MKLITKAEKVKNTEKGKKMKAKDLGGSNKEYEVLSGQEITVSHIGSLLLYTNKTKIQYLYKKEGCRLKKEDEDNYKNIIPRNKQIWNWCRLFREAVTFYGYIPTQKMKNNTFYHGLSVPLLFAQFAPSFQLPLSTTFDISVANRFGNGTGIILVLAPMKSCLDKCLDVSWMSDYAEERERVFCKALGSLIVYDIRKCGKSCLTSNVSYLCALSLFDRLTKGEYFVKITTKQDFENAQKTLVELITTFMVKNKHKKEKNYFQKLFHFFVITKGKEKIMFVKSEYDVLEKDVKNLLFKNEQTMIASEFMNSLGEINNISFIKEFIWTLKDGNLKRFKNLNTDANIWSPDFELSKGIKFKFNPNWPEKIQKIFTFNKQIFDNLFWSLFWGVPIWTTYEVLSFWFYASGLVPFVQFSEAPIYFFIILLIKLHFH